MRLIALEQHAIITLINDTNRHAVLIQMHVLKYVALYINPRIRYELYTYYNALPNAF